MEAMWFGDEEGSFFDYNSISKNRNIKYPMLPNELAESLGNSTKVRIQPKQPGEKRILSADIALMKSNKHKNDATSIFVNQMMPTRSGRYVSNIVYCDAYEGLRTEDQAMIIRKMYDEYECDYIVLDANGIGLGIYDCMSKDMVDPETGEVYPALSCCNNADMAARCVVPGAEKVIWSVKAGAKFNSDCAYLLREGFRSGRIRLLATEYDADKYMSEIKQYNSLAALEKERVKLAHTHTTLLVNELTKLQYEESNNLVRIFERPGMRKDRYSSLSYNYYVAMQIEAKIAKQTFNDPSDVSFIIKAPKYTGRAVSATRGNGKAWNHW